MAGSTAIPTRYRDTQFRSRLEARWAAMFDALGWPWRYEAVDYAGWIPDFVLPFGPATVCVEVKPFTAFEEPLVSATQAEIDRSGCPYDVLVLGALGPALHAPDWQTQEVRAITHFGPTHSTGLSGGPAVLGWLGEVSEVMDQAGVTRYQRWWQDAVCTRCARCADTRLGFYSRHGDFTNRVCGCHDGDHHLSPVALDVVAPLWASAGNAVQYKRPRTTGTHFGS